MQRRGEWTSLERGRSERKTRVGGCVGVKVSDLGGSQGMQRSLRFYSECSGKPLEGFNQETVKT